MNVRQIEQFVKDKVQRDKIINSAIRDISQILREHFLWLAFPELVKPICTIYQTKRHCSYRA